MLAPGDEDPRRKEGENEEELDAEQATRYKGVVARANYLAADRPDLMYATKEVCRGVAKPTKQDSHKLKRLGRFLVGSSRTIMIYDWQGHEREVLGYSDSDWAGCRLTRKSASGGSLLIGSNFFKGGPELRAM